MTVSGNLAAAPRVALAVAIAVLAFACHEQAHAPVSAPRQTSASARATSAPADPLPSWNASAAKTAILQPR